MKKYASVANLGLRLVWPRVLGTFLAAALVQIIAAYRQLMPDGVPIVTGLGFERVADHIIPSAIALLGFLLGSLISGSGEGKAVHSVYTLRRLGISEARVTVVFAVVFSVIFFLFWMLELGILFGLFAWHQSLLYSGPNALMLAVWRSDWFHFLLPMQEWTGYLRNIILCVTFGSCAAMGGHQHRHGKTPWLAFLPLVIFLLWHGSITVGMGAADWVLIVLMLACAAGMFFVVKGGVDDEDQI